MGIFEAIRSARAKTKAEIRAAEAKAKADSKARAKLDLRREKLLAQQERNLLKAEQKGLKAKNKHELKLAKNVLEQRKQGRVNAARLRRWSGAARLLIPLLLPLVYQLTTQARDQLLKNRARKVGVTTEQLSEFAGYGAPLKARIAGVRDSANSSGLPRGFLLDVEERLNELDAAVDNAEYMSPQQRTRAHQTISRDLNQVSDQIQDRLLDAK
ncbi:DUF6474 family protein [Corynebacterium pacaense]|uniref:DUF6474 family protein n=1 Tax=Corynebacterium pacaense TaxID=1816684 RepID=UPI0009BAC18F|nr:DUF6474 family protein [Corynebacterium pacaense]